MTVGDFGIEPWPEAREFHFTLEDGHVTAVTLTGTIENAGAMGVDTPDGLCAAHRHGPGLGAGGGLLLVPRPAGPDDGAGAGETGRKDFVIHQPGVVITSDIQAVRTLAIMQILSVIGMRSSRKTHSPSPTP